jgi:hypothetical protein
VRTQRSSRSAVQPGSPDPAGARHPHGGRASGAEPRLGKRSADGAPLPQRGSIAPGESRPGIASPGGDVFQGLGKTAPSARHEVG